MLKKFKKATSKLSFFKKKQYSPKEPVIDGITYLVREITSEDIKQLLQVERLVYAGKLPWTKSAFLSEIYSRFKHLYLCISHEARIIGFIGIRIFREDGHITNVAVIPEYQGHGIGSFLIQEIEAYARKQQCDILSLEVRIGNRDAQRLYRKMGFVSRTVKSAYYNETNEDALDMVKYLND